MPVTTPVSGTPVSVAGFAVPLIAQLDDMQDDIDLRLLTSRIASATVSITPVANTPTSQAVSWGKTLPATPHVAVAANTTVIGSTVMGASFSSPTTTGATFWVYRTNTAATSVTGIAVALP